METYSLSQLSEETLRALVTLRIQVGVSDKWENMQQEALTPAEHAQIDYLKSILRERDLVVMNEATLWARAIYPLLVLAEQTYVQAWAGVPLKATYSAFQLEGEADGALAPAAAGKPQQPISLCTRQNAGFILPIRRFNSTVKCSLLHGSIGKVRRIRNPPKHHL